MLPSMASLACQLAFKGQSPEESHHTHMHMHMCTHTPFHWLESSQTTAVWLAGRWAEAHGYSVSVHNLKRNNQKDTSLILIPEGCVMFCEAM